MGFSSFPTAGWAVGSLLHRNSYPGDPSNFGVQVTGSCKFGEMPSYLRMWVGFFRWIPGKKTRKNGVLENLISKVN